MNYLSSSFKEDLNRLPAEKLVKRYGTHVLTNFTIGGRYKLLFRSVITNTTENSVKRKTIASGLKALVGDIGIGVNFDRNVETSETLTRENKHRMLYVLFMEVQELAWFMIWRKDCQQELIYSTGNQLLI